MSDLFYVCMFYVMGMSQTLSYSLKILILWLLLFFWGLYLVNTGVINVTTDVANDLYYKMNGANLNTMNSYILPTKNDIDPETYSKDSEWKYSISSSDNGLSLGFDSSEWFKAIHIMSTYPWYIIMWILMIMLRRFGVRKPDSYFGQVIRLLFEGIWWFFEDIMGRDRKHWIKVYVVSLFFVILLSNLFGLVNDIIRFSAPQYLRWVTSPTGEFESAIALALVSIVVTLYVQMNAVWWPHKLFLEYIPLTGKGLIDGKDPISRVWDVFISLFIGLLDIVWLFAKLISLSIRLFGNMSAGSILLNVIFIGIGMATVGLVWFNIPIGLPIIIYIQWLLSSIIQAFVFALLVGIGISMVDE